MVKIVKADDSDLEGLGKILTTLVKSYSFRDFAAYVVQIDDSEKSFIFINNEKGIFYIPKMNKYIRFDLNVQGLLEKIYYKDCEIDYEGSLIIKDNMEYSLKIEEKDDESLYNGEVLFSQSNKSTDESCDIYYDHMYYKGMNISPIYKNHTKQKEKVKFTRNKKIEDYFRKEINPDNVYYSSLKASNGITDDKNESFTRYFRLRIIFGLKTGLFKKGITESEMDDYIASKGFLTEIPELLFDIYNENDSILKNLSDAIFQIKEINVKKDDSRRLLVSIKE